MFIRYLFWGLCLLAICAGLPGCKKANARNANLAVDPHLVNATPQLSAHSGMEIIRITQPPKLATPPSYPIGPVDLCVEVSNIQWTIDHVVFLEGEKPIGTSSTAPYTYIWSYPTVGTHAITAKAVSAKGDFSLSTPNTFLVTDKAPSVAQSTAQANTAPGIALLTPAGNSMVFCAPASIILTAQAWDSNGSVTALDFYVNNVKTAGIKRSALLWTLALNKLGPGNYAVKAEAVNNEGVKTLVGPCYFSVIRLTVLGPKSTLTVGGPAVTFRIKAEHHLTASSQHIVTASNLSIAGYEQLASGTPAEVTPQQVSIHNLVLESHTQVENGVYTDVYRCIVDTRGNYNTQPAAFRDHPTGIGTESLPMFNNHYRFAGAVAFSATDTVYGPVNDVRVNNLNISHVATNVNVYYGMFNPSSGNAKYHTLPVTFTIDGLDDAKSYTWEVYLWPTDINGEFKYGHMSGTAIHPGKITASWDGTISDGTKIDPSNYGTFTYDILVRHGNSIDSQWFKSKDGGFSSDSEAAGDGDNYKMTYVVSGSKWLINPTMDILLDDEEPAYSHPALDCSYDGEHSTTYQVNFGGKEVTSVRALLMVDVHANRYTRDHLNRPSYCRNGKIRAQL